MDIFRVYRYNSCHCLQKRNTYENAIEQAISFSSNVETFTYTLIKGFNGTIKLFATYLVALKDELNSIQSSSRQKKKPRVVREGRWVLISLKGIFLNLFMVKIPSGILSFVMNKCRFPNNEALVELGRINFQPQWGKTNYFEINQMQEDHCH